MAIIGIEIPQFDEEQDIEVEVRVNGIKKQYQYRIELFNWIDCPNPDDDKASCIKTVISGYDPDWSLAHIGLPTDDYIPITFKKKN